MTKLTHLNETGAASMVDVGEKPHSRRSAIASGIIHMTPDALDAIRSGNAPKGDVLSAARIAAIMGAKKTADLIPLCHPLAISSADCEFEFLGHGIKAVATVKLTGQTGVEMEALTAVSVALLTIYDMGKAIDKGMRIENIRLLSKTGGKSGDWTADT